MCHITFPAIPSTTPWIWPYDDEIDRLQRRIAELEREAERQRLRRRVEDLERQVGRRPWGPCIPTVPAIPVMPMVPAPIHRPARADDIVKILERQAKRQ